MAERDKDQERTEQASPRRREEARKKGQVARSQEFSSVAVLAAGLVFFYFGSSSMVSRIMDLMKNLLRDAGATSLENASSVQSLLVGLMIDSFFIIFPFLVAVIAAGLLANYFQVGFMFSAEPLTPDLSKIDPIKGFQRLFSLRAFAELVKNILKIAVISVVVYLTLRSEAMTTLMLADRSIWDIMACVGDISFKIIFRTCWVLLFLAALDYLYQRWEFEKSLRMTKQEVKDEHKQTEGDPLVKARIRRIQREIARRRMMAKVPKADVVITNPDHLAVALKYEAKKMSTPVVVAKGAGETAEKIRKIARENGVPVLENKPLARALFKLVKVNGAVPEQLYRLVAEVLAYVYSLRKRAAYLEGRM
jgi:flagellar biosynthetic protein FlhB